MAHYADTTPATTAVHSADLVGAGTHLAVITGIGEIFPGMLKKEG